MKKILCLMSVVLLSACAHDMGTSGKPCSKCPMGDKKTEAPCACPKCAEMKKAGTGEHCAKCMEAKKAMEAKKGTCHDATAMKDGTDKPCKKCEDAKRQMTMGSYNE
jgi:hypothetical protein